MLVIQTAVWSRPDSLGGSLRIVLDTLKRVQWVEWLYADGTTLGQVQAQLEAQYGRGKARKENGELRALSWQRGDTMRVLAVETGSGRLTQWLGLRDPRGRMDVEAIRAEQRASCLRGLESSTVLCNDPWRWLYE